MISAETWCDVHLSVLRHRHVRTLALAQAAATLGDRLFHMTVVWLFLSAGSTWIAAIVAATAAVPSLLTAIGGPRVIDRCADLRLLSVIDLTCAAAVGALAVSRSEQLPTAGVLIVGLLIGVHAAVGRPNVQALIPSLVSRKEAGQVIAMLDLVDRIALAAGPGLAALLLTVLSRPQLLVANAATYIVSAGTLLLVRRSLARAGIAVRRPSRAGDVEVLPRGVPFRLRPDLRYAIGVRAAGALLWPTVTLGIPLLVVDGYEGEVAGYGAVLTAFAAASVVGNLVAGNLRTVDLRVLCGLAWGVAGLLFLGLSAATSLPVLVAVYGVVGLIVPIGIVSIDMAVARSLSESHRAEVYATQRGVVDGANLIGLMMAPIFLEWGPRAAIALVGAAMVVVVSGIVTRWRVRLRVPRPVPAAG